MEAGGDNERDVADGEPENRFQESLDPAVAPIDSGRARRASLMTESPVRPVAYIDAEPPAGEDQGDNTRRTWLMIAAAAAVAAAFVFSVWLGSRSGETVVASPQNGSITQADETLGGSFDAADDPADSAGIEEIEEIDEAGIDGEQVGSAKFDDSAGVPPKESILVTDVLTVGDLVVANGRSMLAELAAVHQGLAADRGAQLATTSSCWFGVREGDVLTNVYCGPIEATKARVSYDAIPVTFEQDPNEASIVVATAVPAMLDPDQQIDDDVELIGIVDPPKTDRGTRSAPGD